MRLDQRLNFIIPVERDDGVTVYVHAMPISRETFERYFLVIARTFSAISTEGIGITRVIVLMLRKIASDMGIWDGPGGVENGLMNEIRRLANVVTPGPKGWETIPFADALAVKILSEEDVSEVENALVFFTVVSVMNRRRGLKDILDNLGQLWSARTSPLNCTEYAASLPTLKEAVSSGATVVVSSLKS